MQYNVSDFKKIEEDLAASFSCGTVFSLLQQVKDIEEERHKTEIGN